MKLNDLPVDELEHICTYLDFEAMKNLSEVSTSLLKIRPDFTKVDLKAKQTVLHLKKMPVEIILELNKTKVIYKKANIEKAWTASFAKIHSLSAVAGSGMTLRMEAAKVYGGAYVGRLLTVENLFNQLVGQGGSRKAAVTVTVVHSFVN